MLSSIELVALGISIFLLIGFLILWKRISTPKKSLILSECIFILDGVVENLRDELQLNIELMKKKYEVNSPLSSNHLFNQDVDQLIRDSTKKVLDQLSDELKKCLLTYYSNEGLIKLIMIKLKND